MKWLHLILMLCVPQLSMATNAGTISGGGGGNGVVCFDSTTMVERIRTNGGYIDNDMLGNITSIESYDLFEARQPRGMAGELVPQIIEPAENEQLLAYVRRIINNRARFIVPRIANHVSDALFRLNMQRIIRQPFGLEPVNDVNTVSLIDSGRCVLATLASHFFEGEYTYLHLDQRLFEHPRHSRTSQAVLLLHELLYMVARRQFQHTDSRNTRILISYLIASNPEITAGDVLRAAQALGFQSDDDRIVPFPAVMLFDAHRFLSRMHGDYTDTFRQRAFVLMSRCVHGRNLFTGSESTTPFSTLIECRSFIAGIASQEGEHQERAVRFLADVDTFLREWNEDVLQRFNAEVWPQMVQTAAANPLMTEAHHLAVHQLVLRVQDIYRRLWRLEVAVESPEVQDLYNSLMAEAATLISLEQPLP